MWLLRHNPKQIIQEQFRRLLASAEVANVKRCGVASICKGTFAENARGRKLSWGFRVVIAVAVAALFAPTHVARAADGPTVGMVTKVENLAQVGVNAAAVGTLVHMNDTIRTGAKARLQVTFRDNTNLTLGENASVIVDRYVFDPDAGVGEATLNATKGAFRMVTGRLSEMPNKDIKVSTPFAALAVRGTDFWWGPIKGQSGVLLVHNSRLEVRGEDCPEGTDTDRRRCRCAVTLDQAEEGTYLDRRTGCPGKPRHWTPAEVESALSTTSFSLAFGPSQAIPAAAAAAAAAAFAVSTSNNGGGSLPPLEPPKPRSP